MKTIVKVGKTSKVQLRNCEVYRAITMDELELLISADNSINIVIIESILEIEQEQLRQFIRNYTSIGDNHIIFYIPDVNETTTSGIADEFEYDILMNLGAVHKEIERITGVNVSTKINWKEKETKTEQVIIDKGIEIAEKEKHNKEENISNVDNNTTYDPYTEEYKILQSDNEELRSKLDGVVSKLTERNKEVTELQHKIEQLQTSLYKIESETDKEKSEERQDNNDNTIRIQQLQSEIAEYKETCKVLKTNTETLRVEKEALAEKIKEYSDELNNNEKIIEDYRVKCESYEKKIEELNGRLSELGNKVERLLDEKSEVEHRAETLQTYTDKYKEEVESTNREYERLKETTDTILSDKDRIISEKEEKIEALVNSVESLENKLRGLESDDRLDKLKVEFENLELDKKASDERVRQLEGEYSNLLNQIGGDISSIDTIKSSNEALTLLNSNLKDRIIELEGKNSTLQADNKKLNNSINTLKENESILKESLETASKLGTTGDIQVPQFKYSENGKIINVFGHGSYGITTTVMSMAVRMGQSNRVVILDLDITSPSLDQWTSKSPYIKEYNTIEMQFRTGLGIIIKRGFSAFMDTAGAIGTLKESKAGCVDYITGLYGRAKSSEIASAEYEKLFKYLGDNYDYIIIDSGRTGESPLHDSLIIDICNIAYKNVYVINGSSVLQVNSAVIKLKNSGIDISRIIAFINMCTNSGISQNAKKLLSGMKYETMYAENSLVFNNKPYFTENNLTREKFESLIQEVE